MQFIINLAAFAAAAAPPVPASAGQAFGDAHFNFAVSRDGKRLAVCGWAIWDVAARKKLLAVRSYGFTGMDFSPDGKWFACGGNHAVLHVFDARTGKLYWELSDAHGGSVVTHVEFTPDGKYMVTGAIGSMIRVWDVKRKTPIALYCFPSPYLAYDQVIQDDYLKSWRSRAGNVRNPDDVKTYVMHKHPIKQLRQLAISPDGKHLALTTWKEELLVVELMTGKIVRILRTVGTTGAVRFSPDGKTLAVGTGGRLYHEEKDKANVELWAFASGKLLRRWSADADSVFCLAFAPNGKILASGGAADGAAIWEAATGKLLYRKHERVGKEFSWIKAIAIHPDGKTLLTLPTQHDQSPVVHFWDIATGKRIMQPLGK